MANKTVTVRPSGGTYTSLAAAITGEVTANADLTATGMDGILTISIEGTWVSADSNAATVLIAGFTTDSTHYVSVIDSSGGTYVLEAAGGYFAALEVRSASIIIKGIHVRNTSVGGPYGIYNTWGALTLDSIKITGYSEQYGIKIRNGNILNCEVHGDVGGGIFIDGQTYDTQSILYNNTVGNCDGIGIRIVNTPTYIKNCYSGGNTGADYSVSGATVTYTTCYSEDGTGTTSTAPYTTATFTNVTSGSENFSLPTGSALIGTGTSLVADGTYPFNWDILGKTRDGYWDIGSARKIGNKTVTVMPSGQGGTYTTLASAITGEVSRNPSLINMDGILTISIEGTWSSADTSAADVTGFTVDSTHYVNIVADSSNRAGTSYASGKYRLNPNIDYLAALKIINSYTRIVGLQIKNSGSVQATAVWASASTVSAIIDSCFVYGSGGTNYRSSGILDDGTNDISINNIIIDSGYAGFYKSGNGGAAYLYNCIIAGTGGVGVYTGGYRVTYAKNVYSGDNTGDDYYFDGLVTPPSLTNCYSEDGTRSTSTAPYTTATFKNINPGAEDLSLAYDSPLIGVGTNLSADPTFPFNWDILGNIRSSLWDIGASFYYSTLLQDIVTEIWNYTSRTTDGQTASASDGTLLEDIVYAIWTNSSREEWLDILPKWLDGTVTNLQSIGPAPIVRWADGSIYVVHETLTMEQIFAFLPLFRKFESSIIRR